MKKWLKRITIALLVIFVYLGTGYQFGVLNWDMYHSKEYADFRVNDRLGKGIYQALWPMSTHIATTKELTKTENQPIVVYDPFTGKQQTQKNYIEEMTYLWGIKLITNVYLFMINLVADTVLLLGTAVYSFVKFIAVIATAAF